MVFKDKTHTKKIIRCAFKVYSILGMRFIENKCMNKNVKFKFILSIVLILSLF